MLLHKKSQPPLPNADYYYWWGLLKDDRTDDGTDNRSIISLNWAILHRLVADGQWVRRQTK